MRTKFFESMFFKSMVSQPRVLVYLLVYAAVWTTVRALAEVNLDGYGDMLENFAWGQSLELGTFKHPPLVAWMTGLWFSLMPRADGFYYGLSYLNGALGLVGVYYLAVSWGMKNEAALSAALLLAMSLPYSTLAAKFNANSVLISTWPWVAFFCMKSIQAENRTAGNAWSLALGLSAALSMLGKYYSGVFLLGLFIMALSSPAGRRWLVTFRAWLALSIFVIALLPHARWLSEHAYITLHYVQDQGDGQVGWGNIRNFILSPLFYWGLPWVICCVFVAQEGERWSRLAQRMTSSWMPHGWNDSLFWLAVSPWLITLVFGLSGFVELSLPWAIPIGLGFPLLWLRNLSSVPGDDAPSHASIRRTFLAYLCLVMLLSPVYAWWQSTHSTKNYYAPRRELAAALLQAWQARHPQQPLTWIGGQWSENAAVAFYGEPGIRVIPGVPDEGPARFVPNDHWRTQAGLLLCGMGQVSAGERQNTTDAQSECVRQSQQWLEKNGKGHETIELIVHREGRRFPRTVDFRYLAFVYLP